MADNTSNERKRRVANGSGNVHKRGDGLGTGPVGNGPRGQNPSGQGGSSRPSGTQKPNSTGPSGRANGDRGNSSDLIGALAGAALSGAMSGGSKKGGLGKLILIVAVIALLGGGGTGIFSMLGSGGSSDSYQTQQAFTPTAPPQTTSSTQGGASTVYGTNNLSSVLSSLGISGLVGGTGMGSYDTLTAASNADAASGTAAQAQTVGTYNTWSGNGNTGSVNEEVDGSARAKRTVIKGNGQDTITIMVYLCGTDLESKYKMGTSDLQEMLNASLNPNINLIVYTGGCKKWNNSVVSSQTNQIYQLKDGKMYCLSDNEGAKPMTDPATLTGFIKYCTKTFPANRNELILWDHGGGSITGYGYDEKFSNAGSMDLGGISTALKNAGVTFDFIGFDACLMATAETALMLDDYADYMIASEESEPGVGWYYTDWLTKLSQNTSMPTVNIGKNICDDFVRVCGTTCRGQTTTLSVIDLAEFAATVPSKLSSFAKATTDMIKGNDYKTVASARNKSHEFAASSRIDQVDLIHFAKNLGTTEAKELEKALLGAIKYNKTSSDVTNAYGVSIYFPCKSTKYVKNAVSTYGKIGLGSEYSDCIKSFANLAASGQVAAGGNNGSASSLLGMLGGSTASQSYGSSDMTQELISGLLSSFLGGRSMTTIDGLDDSNMDFMAESEADLEATASYIAANHFDGSKLEWTKTPEGYYGINLSNEQWSLVTDLALSMYYDDGEGYMDLGVDNIFCFDDNGNLLVPQDVTWMAVCDNLDGEEPQVVAYYYDSMTDDGVHFTINGHIPAFLNDDRVNLLVVFDNENPYGYIAGAQRVYTNEDGVEVLAKSSTALEPGDKLDFICDYYSYDGEYLDTYYLGEQMKVTNETSLWSVELNRASTSMMYRFKDIYNQTYWSSAAH